MGQSSRIGVADGWWTDWNDDGWPVVAVIFIRLTPRRWGMGISGTERMIMDVRISELEMADDMWVPRCVEIDCSDIHTNQPAIEKRFAEWKQMLPGGVVEDVLMTDLEHIGAREVELKRQEVEMFGKFGENDAAGQYALIKAVIVAVIGIICLVIVW